MVFKLLRHVWLEDGHYCRLILDSVTKQPIPGIFCLCDNQLTV